MTQKSFESKDLLVQYATDHSLRFTPAQKGLYQATLENDRAGMMGAPEVLQLMANLITTIGAKKVLDIGVFTGCSALSAALAMPEDGEVHALDMCREWVDIGVPFFEEAGVSSRIKVHIGPALDTLKRFVQEGQAGTFDFAFIDADKVNYEVYYEQCLVLLRKGGIIAVDNTLWYGSVIDSSNTSPSTVATRAFNERVYKDDRVGISLLTIADGLTLLFIK